MIRQFVGCFVFSLVLAAAAPAQQLTLTADAAGPYLPGASLSVSVDLQGPVGAPDRYLRLVQLDTRDTDAAITFDNPFSWDFSTLGNNGASYTAFGDLPIPQASFLGMSLDAPNMLLLDGDGSPLRLGSFDITLPAAPGIYVLDVLTAADTPLDPDTGTLISSGFGTAGDPIIESGPGLGNLTGGTLALTVVPEPATIGLVLLGGMALIRRRRQAAR